MKKILLITLLTLCINSPANTAEITQLPEPTKSGGITLTQALNLRKSSRNFANTNLTNQQLSNLLWATAGVNRTDGKKVYPTAINRQDMIIYVINSQGVYRYSPEGNCLEKLRDGDHRPKTGAQPFVGSAAVNLAYVQDMSRWNESPEHYERGINWGFVHAGEITQNAALFAAGQEWANVVRGMFDQEVMKELLGLGGEEFVRLVHSIGPEK